MASTACLILALCGLSASASSPSSCQPAARRVHGGRGRRRAAAEGGSGGGGCRGAWVPRRAGRQAAAGSVHRGCARACLLQLLHHHLDRQRVPATPPPHASAPLRAARLRPVPAHAARGGAGDAGGAQRGGRRAPALGPEQRLHRRLNGPFFRPWKACTIYCVDFCSFVQEDGQHFCPVAVGMIR